MIKLFRQLLLILTAILFFQNIYSQELINGSFEILNAAKFPRNWEVYDETSKYQIVLDSLNVHSGKYSLLVNSLDYKEASTENSAVLANTFGLVSSWKATKISLSGFIKTDEKRDSAIALFVQNLSGNTIIRKYLNSGNHAGWIKLDLDFEPPSDKAWYGFYYGVEISKNTFFNVDDMVLAVNGKTIGDPLAFSYKPSQKEIRQLNRNIYPIKIINGTSHEPGLISVAKFVKNSKIIGVGEPTHGSSEASKFKLQLLKYLVEHEGFTTFALEENIPTADSFNTIINGDKLSLRESLLKMPFYKLWKTQELLDVFEWIRNYNSIHSGKIKFIGIDMEDSWLANSMQMFHTEKGGNIYKKVNDLQYNLDSLKSLNRQKKFDAAASLAQLMIDTIHQLEIANPENDGEFKFNSYLRVCEQWLSTRFIQNQETKNRDEYMADNLSYYHLYHPGEKIFLWAHNTHIANLESPLKTMGAFLKDKFVENYIPLCITSADGMYLAAKDDSQQVWNPYAFEKAYQGTYEFILEKAIFSDYFLSFNKISNARWLGIKMQQLDHGYILGDGADYKFLGGALNRMFDGLIFIKKTTASKSLINEINISGNK